MKKMVFCIAIWTFLLSYVSTFDLRNKTACFPFPLSIDPPCAETEMILPRNFILGTSSNKTCHEKISNDLSVHNVSVHRDINSTRYCCQLRDNDELTEYCLPSKKQQINHNSYREFVDECIGRKTCTLNGKVQPGSDYVTLQYECVPKTYVMKILENSSITDKTVFLYIDRLLPTSGRQCTAYSMDCEATITVKMVASNIPDNTCSITYSENNNQSTFSCSNLDPDGECRPVYRSTSNLVDIHINMIKSTGSRSLLWLEIEGTSENVTVTCDGDLPVDVPRGCPSNATTKTNLMIITTPSPISSLSILNSNNTHTTNQLPSKSHEVKSSGSTAAGHETSSHTTDVSSTTVSSGEEPLSKKFLITIIGSSIGGIAVLLLTGLAFLFYSRRRQDNRVDSAKGESKRAVLGRQLSNSDRDSATCENPIYETDDFKLKVRDSILNDEDKVKGGHDYDYNITDPYSTIGGDKVVGTNPGGRTDSGDKPFGTDLRIKRNSWVNSCPDFMGEMAVSESLAKLDDILNGEESRDNQVSDVYAKVLPKEERNKGLGPDDMSDMYAKVVPKAKRN